MGIFFSYLLIVPRNRRWISTVLTPLAISSCNVLLQHRPSYPPLAPFSRILGLSGCRVVGFSNSRPLATFSHDGYILLSYPLIVPRNMRCISTVLSHYCLPPFSRILGLSGCRVVGFSNSRPLATSSRLGYILLSCLLIVPRNKRCISTVLLQHPLALLSRTILSDCQVVGLSGYRILILSVLVLPHGRSPAFSSSRSILSDWKVLPQ